MKTANILVKKSTGDLVPFSEAKLVNSLRRSGASEDTVRQILEEVNRILFTGIHTREIYKTAFRLLKKTKGAHAGKYKLKMAIMEIGPSGFPFEKFVGAILRVMGYETEVDIVLQGHCVTHEVDVIAKKGDTLTLIECKFHNSRGHHCDVKVPLYINSRFRDIEEQWIKNPVYKEKKHFGWVMTNTKFTQDAIQYGECMGMKLIGWSYPNDGSLRDMIDSTGLYPVTCLSSLTKFEKESLLAKGVVLTREILSDNALLTSIGIVDSRVEIINREASQLCSDKR